ncbi:hypothetical protein [Hymenobacter glaciei]|uniref:hypothetical protein n=1 Tax=Hymenobacter glaciei TaxID=877209 RepID=UPI0031E93C0E
METALAANNEQAAQRASAIARYIAREVCRNRNQARDIAVLTQTQQIVARTQSLADTLRTLRRKLQKNGSNVATTDLLRHLGRYQAFIRTYVPDAANPTRPVSGAPEPDWFDRFYFQHMPLEARRAALTKLEAIIRRNAAQALSLQSQKIGSCCMCLTRIGAMAVPASETVAPGGEYQARLFLAEAMYLNRATMQLTANGRKVPLDENGDGVGRVAFSVPATTTGQADTFPTIWHGVIRVQMCPTDSVFEVDVPFSIVKPQLLK